jgi:hypothetical protein
MGFDDEAKDKMEKSAFIPGRGVGWKRKAMRLGTGKESSGRGGKIVNACVDLKGLSIDESF